MYVVPKRSNKSIDLLIWILLRAIAYRLTEYCLMVDIV